PVEIVGPTVGEFPQIGAVEAVGAVLVAHIGGPAGAEDAIPQVLKGLVGDLHGDKFGLHNDSKGSGVIIDTLINRLATGTRPQGPGVINQRRARSPALPAPRSPRQT